MRVLLISYDNDDYIGVFTLGLAYLASNAGYAIEAMRALYFENAPFRGFRRS